MAAGPLVGRQIGTQAGDMGWIEVLFGVALVLGRCSKEWTYRTELER